MPEKHPELPDQAHLHLVRGTKIDVIRSLCKNIIRNTEIR
jgi:hypothetical protein